MCGGSVEWLPRLVLRVFDFALTEVLSIVDFATREMRCDRDRFKLAGLQSNQPNLYEAFAVSS